jgi:hypothetical protein
MTTAVGEPIAEWMTTPAFYAAAGFETRNCWTWFTVKHPQVLKLRRRAGAAWLWPSSAISQVKKLREAGGGK